MDASGHLRTVSALLDLDEFEVVDLQQDRRTKQNVIGVIPKLVAGLCPHCQGVCDERHQTRESRVMDLPLTRRCPQSGTIAARSQSFARGGESRACRWAGAARS